MFAALATLVFAATLWLLVMLAARLLEQNGDRIAAVLRRRQDRVGIPAVSAVRFSPRLRVSTREPMRARPQLRAAA